MRLRLLLFVLIVAVPACVPHAWAAENSACAVTQAPAPSFTPPPPFDPLKYSDGRYFLFGTPGLWAYIHNRWKLHEDGAKLPYFSQHYKWMEEGQPRMAVVAKRLDAPAPLVWAEWVNGAGPSHLASEPVDLTKPGFMVTRLDIPLAGCWEVSARYFPDRGRVETLSYTILVEP